MELFNSNIHYQQIAPKQTKLEKGRSASLGYVKTNLVPSATTAVKSDKANSSEKVTSVTYKNYAECQLTCFLRICLSQNKEK